LRSNQQKLDFLDILAVEVYIHVSFLNGCLAIEQKQGRRIYTREPKDLSVRMAPGVAVYRYNVLKLERADDSQGKRK
jgi:hypothetical protein